MEWNKNVIHRFFSFLPDDADAPVSHAISLSLTSCRFPWKMWNDGRAVYPWKIEKKVHSRVGISSRWKKK
jgi:hypothetical protein